MHKLFFIFLFTGTYIYANINVVVSILPQQTFIKAIGGDKVDVTLMVQPGESPHTYEPKPSQMIALSKTNLYLSIDVEFEHVWLPKFQAHNEQMHTIDVTKGIEKISMQKERHTEEAHTQEKHQHEDHHDHEGNDPHVWTSPHNVKIIAQNIFEALQKYDVNHTAYYKKNLKVFLSSIEETDTKIKALLSTIKDRRSFMVFHPSWGYFAKAYNLKQIAVEVEGKSPKPKALIKLIKKAKKEKVHAIFTQPEFSDKSAKIIAKELQIPVLKVSPMAPNWAENLINITKAITGKE
ncbi:MAG: zinc ABC transporter substrate-binding protein [Sulfurovum sp.]|nr:zinc ABC transporter substrate-binding protein [Sulfurovum sp.]